MADQTIIDLGEFRAARDGQGMLLDVMRENVRQELQQIASTYEDGKPDEWIERKAKIVGDMVEAMLGDPGARIVYTVPASLDDETRESAEHAVRQWVATHSEACLRAFTSRLVELLGP